jgi:endo-alpha-1,4-polygalactosaminidase (GH114 family)
VALALLLPAAAAGAPGDARLAGVEDFAFALGRDLGTEAEVARLAPYDLVVVDGESARPARIAQLRAGGSVVLGYLSVGTIEPYRSWYRLLRRFRLPDSFEEFDEPYARVSARGFRRAIAGKIAPRLLGKGFDGLFLDNTDMVEGHSNQLRGMRRLVRRLSSLVRTRGLLLFSQNGERTIGPLLRFYDGWNREDVSWTYSFKRRRYVPRPAVETAAAQSALRRIAVAGLLVTATDYTAPGDGAAEAESLANACAAGAVPFVGDIALRRLPLQPLRCPP